MYKIIFAALICCGTTIQTLQAQDVIPLYEQDKVPNAIHSDILMDTLHGRSGQTGNDTTVIRPRTIMPTLTVFLPHKKTSDIGIIVCSGGSYRNVADPQEGIPAAKKLADAGITVFLLHYRVPRADLMQNKSIVPLQDLQTAIRFARENAKAYKLNPDNIGIMGFSAGGHLVSTAGTHFSTNYIDNPNGVNLRPDFMVLVYPVISMTDSLTHTLSRKNLIGPDIIESQVNEFSNEKQVNSQTPPTFIVHAMDDSTVKIGNSLAFVAALEQQQVPVRFFVYTNGGHGFGINNETARQQWIDPCIEWIRDEKWKQTKK
ncbi:alpha/beta hydrolase [Chitinophaga sp. Cy-1792]|uniref:alpha/beta hydrolase n=1 Tax=Chitinophaga sp. Cy-1792 TaxID=2608339 RepID=UPI00141E3883|nr:alpha/beta hydrolase [Chitinophaga sp. Cy-1792]